MIKRATSICIIDLNRKPRGPKARKAAEGQETEPKRRKDTHSRDVEEKRGNEASSEIDLGRPSQIRKEKERAEEMDLQLPPPAGPSRDFFRGPPQVMSQLNHHRSPSGESSSHTLQAQARDSSNSTSLRSGQVSSPSNSDVRTPSLASTSSLAPTSLEEVSDQQMGQYRFPFQPQTWEIGGVVSNGQFPPSTLVECYSPSSRTSQSNPNRIKTSRSSSITQSSFHDESFSAGRMMKGQSELHLPAYNRGPPNDQIPTLDTFQQQHSNFRPQTLTPSMPQSGHEWSSQFNQKPRRESVSTELVNKLSQFYNEQDRPYISLSVE